MQEAVHLKSISQLHKFLGLGKPLHPLITVIRLDNNINSDFGDMQLNTDLYLIAVKENLDDACIYGRNAFDFDEGTMIFIAPGQIMATSNSANANVSGWTIAFHPNLILKSHLAEAIHSYNFFNYEIYEALHLSDKEKQNLEEYVSRIEEEINQNIDRHSQELIIQNIEIILKYARRFYERQFATRTNQHKDHISAFESFLRNYFQSNQQIENGLPSLEQCGAALKMSGKYLSDLLNAETGKSLKEHVLLHVVDRAKIALLNSQLSVNEIAFALGFKYPQHFSKVFKAKTGFSPRAYRVLN